MALQLSCLSSANTADGIKFHSLKSETQPQNVYRRDTFNRRNTAVGFLQFFDLLISCKG
jgi:hypothetical protein